MADVRVRYFAAAVDAAGIRSETLDVEPATVGTLRRVLADRHGAEMQRVLASGSVLVGGVVRRGDDDALAADVDVLPRFSGG